MTVAINQSIHCDSNRWDKLIFSFKGASHEIAWIKEHFSAIIVFFFRISQRVLDDLKKDLEKFNIEVHIDKIGGRNPLKDMNPKTNVCCRYLSVNQL